MNTLHRTQNFRSNFGYATEWECIVENIVASAALYYITLHSTITGWFRLTQPRGSGLEFRIDANSLKIHTRSQNWVNKVPEYKNVLSKICNVEIGSIRCKGDLFWADAWTVLCICKKKKTSTSSSSSAKLYWNITRYTKDYYGYVTVSLFTTLIF